jgi:hypothetical protein
MTIYREGEGQRVGCRACDVVFRDRTTRDLALVPCPVCDLQGEVISLLMPDTWPSDYTYCISQRNFRGGMHLRVR